KPCRRTHRSSFVLRLVLAGKRARRGRPTGAHQLSSPATIRSRYLSHTQVLLVPQSRDFTASPIMRRTAFVPSVGRVDAGVLGLQPAVDLLDAIRQVLATAPARVDWCTEGTASAGLPWRGRLGESDRGPRP